MIAKPVDVVIVGAGAAGCFYASKLAAAGRSVIVLESGPAWSTQDLISSQLWARRLKWRGAPLALDGEHPISHNASNGSGLGGAALHHYGTWPRIPVDAFEMRARYGRGLDWPISYDALRPYYDRIQGEIGIAGDAAQEIWRGPGEPYPMPPHPRLPQTEVLARGFNALDLPVAPLPTIINSIHYDGRPPCIYDGWCDAGCPTGALANPLVTYHARALKAGAKFETNAEVTRVLADAHGQARAVEYWRNGERREQPARQIILAASVIQNPRILLNSTSDAHPNGLANSSGLVGAYLCAETMAFAYGLFEEETHPYLGVNAGQLTHRGGPKHAGAPQAFGGFQWQIAPAVKPNDLFGVAITRADLFGRALDEFIRRGVKHLGMMVGFGAVTPRRENRVELDERRDARGMKLARAMHTLGGAALALWTHLNDQGIRVMKAAGAKESWSGPRASGHLNGGTIMGADAKTSVTDSYGRCHDAPNVVIAGAGLFPTTGGVSPTFTIHAVALRSVEKMLTEA